MIDPLTGHNPLTRLAEAHMRGRVRACRFGRSNQRKTIMTNKIIGTVATTLCSVLASTGASAKGNASSIAGAMLVQTIGTVQSVDPEAHRVTIVDAQGHATQLNVGSQVHDLRQVPVGSRVNSSAMQPVTLTPVKHAKVQEMIPGDKEFVAQVSSVDESTGVVVLKDANQLPIEIHAQDAHEAAKLSSGSLVKVVLQTKK
jgi:hypothetical protein